MATDTGDAADIVVGGLSGRLLAERFRVVEVVSQGANTVIADGLDTATNQPVTIKFVQPELAGSEEFRRQFRRHAEIATALTHPNIATVIAWGDVDLGEVSTVFWVVEFLGGGSMRDLFDRGRLLQPSQALVVGLEACRALDVAHQRGIVHTELTPAKMVFGEDRRLRIVDFGFARLLGAEAWTDPATVPTHVARYASPEQALGLEVDVKTDVYALTLALIEAVTGSVPFAADSTVATLSARIGKLMPVSADLGSLAAVLERAGRPESADRSTAAELGKALVAAAAKLPRPEPIPIVAGGLFATSELRRPSDPTGGPARPVAAADTGAATVVEEPAVEEPAVESAVEEPASDQPVAGGPAVEEPAVEEPAIEEPAIESLVEESASDQPMAGGQAVEESPVAGDPVAEPSARAESPAAAPVVDDRSEVGAPPGGEGPTGSEGPPGSEAPVAPRPAAAARATAPPAATGAPAATASPVAAAPASPGGDAAPDGSPLILLTDVADPPTGAVQVGTGRIAGAPAAPTATATVQMPAAPPPAPAPAVYDEERRRRPIFKIFVLALVVLAGLAALTYSGWLLLRTKSFEVPELAGVNQDVALNEIAGNGWRITIERERNDDEPTIDNVIRTVPGPGVELEEGDEFLIVVSDGPELRTLPEVAGLPVVEAESSLAALRLIPVIELREFSETVPLDSVVSWRVQGDETAAAGSQVLPETTILLTVSDGPAPRPAPALAGLLVDQATTEVESRQLVIARDEDVFSDAVPVGVVVSQQPAAGTLVPRGGTVTIQVSKGPDVVAVPDLDGLSYADAEALLLETGFTIGNLLGTTEGTFVSMTIGGESVEVGQIFRRGTAIDLIFL